MRSNIFTLKKARQITRLHLPVGVTESPTITSVSLSGPGLTAPTVKFPSVNAAVMHLASSPRLFSSGTAIFTIRENVI